MAVPVPRTTAAVAVLVIVLSIACMLSDDAKLHFVLIPGNTLLGEHTFWNLVTGGLVELNLFKFLAVVGFVVRYGAVAERNMGSGRFAVYLLAVEAFSGAAASLGALFHYVGTQGDEHYFYGHMFGGLGTCIAVAMALHQQAHDSPVLGIPQLSYQHLPLALLGIAIALELVLTHSQDLPFAVFSFVGAWTFLRFFQPQADGSMGDHRTEFGFLTLFPAPIRPAVKPVIKLLSSFFLRFDLFKRSPPTGSGPNPIPGFGSGASTARGLGSSAAASAASSRSRPQARGGGTDSSIADPVAERRRARALKALDQKLAELSTRKSQRHKSSSPSGATEKAAKPTADSTAAAPAPPSNPTPPSKAESQV